METKKRYFVRRGKRGVLYLQERHCGIRLADCLGTTDERIAEIRRREIHIAVERGDYKNRKTLFADAVDGSSRELFSGKAEKTIVMYESVLRNHVLPWFGQAHVIDIQAQDLTEYKRARESQGVAEASLVKELWLVRWVLKKHGRDVEGPVEPFLKPHKPVDRFATEAEVLSIIGNIKRVDIKAACLVAAYSGLRQSDVLGLKWSAVDFKDGFIKVRQKKTDNVVRVPLHAKLVDALNLVPRGLGDGLVFPDIVTRTLKASWQRARKKAGLDWVRFHDLRHFFASYLASNGVRREVIAEILGHKNLASTARYARFDDETLKEAAQSFVSKVSANKKEGLVKR